MSSPLRIAVIGAGMAGQAHAFGYRNAMMSLSSPIDVELDAIVDPALDLARETARRYGFARAVASVDEILASDVDVISVALPNFVHSELLPAVLASGKHVFAEKPIGRTLAEAQQLERLAGKAKGTTGVGFSFRRLPGLAALQELVAGGALGEIHSARAWYYADYAADPQAALSWRYSQERSGGGALLDIGAHAIDALRFVAGDVAEVSSAVLRTVHTDRPLPARGAIGHAASTSTERGPVDNDDLAMLTLRLAGGAVARVDLSRIATGTPNSLGIELYGTSGHARFDSLTAGEFDLFTSDAAPAGANGARRVIVGPEHPYFRDVAAMPGGGVGTGYAEAFTAEIQEFLRCVRDGRPMDTGFAEATRMMEVVDAALTSARGGTAVAIG